MVSVAKKFQLTFIKKVHLQENIYAIHLEKKDFQFIAGQYVQVSLTHNQVDERGINRYFTIASSPSEEQLVLITTKPKHALPMSSFKRKLLGLVHGNKVTIFGPMGTFTLGESEARV